MPLHLRNPPAFIHDPEEKMSRSGRPNKQGIVGGWSVGARRKHGGDS